MGIGRPDDFKWAFLDPYRLRPRPGRKILSYAELYPTPEYGGLPLWYRHSVFDDRMMLNQFTDLGWTLWRATDLSGEVQRPMYELRREKVWEMMGEGGFDEDKWDRIENTKEFEFSGWRFDEATNKRSKGFGDGDPVKRFRLRAVPYFREAQCYAQGLDLEKEGVDPLYMDVYTNGIYELFAKRRVEATNWDVSDKEKAALHVIGTGGSGWKRNEYTSIDSGYVYRVHREDRKDFKNRQPNGTILLRNPWVKPFERSMSLQAAGIIWSLLFPYEMRFIASRRALKSAVGTTVRTDGIESIEMQKAVLTQGGRQSKTLDIREEQRIAWARKDEEVKGGLWDQDITMGEERGRDVRKIVGRGAGEVLMTPYEVVISKGRKVGGGW